MQSHNQKESTRRAPRKLWRAALLAGVALPLGSVAIAQDTADAPVEEEARQDVVVVTGIRQSLAAAADLKRNDSRIVDAIVAEDIGKLPDQNIAEALQRITGVSISSDFGIGESVSIRGLSENRIELNGRSTIGDDRDGISLDDFPSSFLKTVEVVKSPTADMIEGALGGTVRMNTIRPIELDGFTLAGSLDLEYADKTENWAPIANLAVGNNWTLSDGSVFGFTANLSYQDREIRQDEFFNRVRLYDEPVNGLTANTPSGRFAVREQNTVQQYVQQRERTAANLTLEWAPASQQGSFYADLAYSDRSGAEQGSSILDVGGARTYNSETTQDSNGQVNIFTLTDAFVIPKTWSDFRNTEFSSFAIGGDWEFTDQLSASGEISIGSSDTYRPNSEFNLRPVNRTNHEAWVAGGGTDYNADRSAFGLRHTVDALFIQSGDAIPSVTYSDPNALLASENLAFREFRHDDDRTTNEETAYRFDIEYENPFGLDFVTAVQAGFRFTENDYEFNRLRYREPDLYRYAFNADGTPRVFWLDDIEAAFPGSIETVNHNNSFDQNGLSGQNDLLQYRILSGDVLSNPNSAFAIVQALYDGAVDRDGNPILDGPTLADNLVLQEGAYRDITEETSAFYVSADLEFDRVNAVVGGRFVQTDLSSTILANGAPVSGGNDYDDFLPSLNVSYDLTDETKIRFAAAKVMRRPNYSELSPAFEVDGAIITAERGAIDLDPFRATQFDVSLEHYFGEGGLISAAIFYKDVESFLSSETFCEASSLTSGQQTTEWENVCLLNTAGTNNPNLQFSTLADFAGSADPDAAGMAFTTTQRDAGLTGIRTSRVTNGENGEVQGFELGYQQQFTFLPGLWSGFGVNANYTYADSEQPNGNPLLNISENTLNAQVYWENEQFQARLAYNYRDDFLFTEEETRVANVGALGLNSSTNDVTSASFDPTAGNNYRDARGQLDASASWNINDRFTLVGSITNLTGEPITFSTELGSIWRYYEADRRMSIGVRGKF